jgi:hypothetical protein
VLVTFSKTTPGMSKRPDSGLQASAGSFQLAPAICVQSAESAPWKP